jgi:hypothetical protein
MRISDSQRNRWFIAVVIAGMLLFSCIGLGVGFIIGNLVGEDRVCGEVWDHAENPSDIPICNDPWW